MEYRGKTCPFCKTALTAKDEVAVCDTCDMPMHRTCWQENQGCATFGCTGMIKTIFTPEENPAPVYTPAPPAPSAPAGRMETLYQSGEITAQANAPVVTENIAVLKNSADQKTYARCTLRSLTDRPIVALLLDLVCKDVWGNPVEGVTGYQMLDLRTKRDMQFGQTCPIPLPDPNTRIVTAEVRRIMFADGTMEECSPEFCRFPAAVTLENHFNDRTMAAFYASKVNRLAKFAPVKANGLWRCTCGRLHREEEPACAMCGGEPDALLALLSDPTLPEQMQEVLRAQQLKAEQARIEQENRIREEEEKAKLAREEAEREATAAALKERLRKERKRRITATVCSLVGLAVAACLVVFLLLPYLSYRNACTMLENGQYDEAHQAFSDLGGFMDSEEMANESLYQKAEHHLQLGEYTVAYDLFVSLGDYSDSDTRAKETRYAQARALMVKNDYKGAYQLLSGITGYAEAENLLDTCIYNWADYVLKSWNPSEASTFASTVTLQSKHYATIYTKIITSIESNSYWYKSSYATIVYRMLQELPYSYGDVSNLKRLFALGLEYSSAVSNNLSVFEALWEYDFIQDYLCSDDHIGQFLTGEWCGTRYTTSAGLYITFDESGHSRYNLPHPTQPSNVAYYDIRSLVFIWTDSNSNELTKVFRFTIVDFDIIKVYCYSDGCTYTLYRQ